MARIVASDEGDRDLTLIFYHLAGGEGIRRRLKSPGFEAENRAFEN
jgi:hypothetical protein